MKSKLITVSDLTRPKEVKRKLTNKVFLLLDDSNSMWAVRSQTEGTMNEWVGKIKDLEKETSGIQICFAKFSTFLSPAHKFSAPDFPLLKDYKPLGGSTALYDALVEFLPNPKSEIYSTETADSNILIVLTDGDDNASSRNNEIEASRRIRELQDLGTWTMVFLVPHVQAKRMLVRQGIPEGNITVWTQQEIEKVKTETTSGLDRYYSQVGKGVTKTETFFVTTDLTNLSTSEVVQELDNLTGGFKRVVVNKEEPIKDLVERSTKKPYVLGSTFYKLTKKEKVQDYKDVLIAPMGEKTIYGGRNIKRVLGLPFKGTCVVTPGNHAGWEIYVQSKSTNRKLVRGTVVLIKT